ncbi:CheR family methyltransferase, partial [Erythrobacter donghaensis]
MNAQALSFETLPGISRAVYSPEDFATVQRLAHETAGIVLVPAKSMLVYSRLAPLVRESRFTTFSDYLASLKGNEEELRRVICALTTNHTYFFREDHHFEHLGEEVAPVLIAKARKGQPVRIWSAGCSSGEETWSIVTTILGEDARMAATLAGTDLRILATDLDDNVLNTARAASYSTENISAMPAELRRLWTQSSGATTTINPQVRNLVSFNRLNLLHDWPMKRQFDVIFCRNVMIYFDQ